VLSVGRAAEAKGQPLLIEAMAELRQRGVEARLTVVGDGPLLGELRAQVRREGLEDRVTLTGAVGQDRIRDYYERADVFALSSFAEGLPTVLVEALAMEVPVVTTWVMGVPELVEDGVSGLLVPPGRADALANALERLLAESPQRRAGMGQAGRRKVGGEFALDRSARELCDLFEASAQPSS
jgi:glycosyltransferase involved in cell wall biosynthesis